jgi:hypothetical protein
VNRLCSDKNRCIDNEKLASGHRYLGVCWNILLPDCGFAHYHYNFAYHLSQHTMRGKRWTHVDFANLLLQMCVRNPFIIFLSICFPSNDPDLPCYRSTPRPGVLDTLYLDVRSTNWCGELRIGTAEAARHGPSWRAILLSLFVEFWLPGLYEPAIWTMRICVEIVESGKIEWGSSSSNWGIHCWFCVRSYMWPMVH